MKSYLLFYAIIWALVMILMGLFVRLRHKNKFPTNEEE